MEEEDEVPVVTVEEQFYYFSRLNDPSRTGNTITLYRSDYWLRQSGVLDDRHLKMSETGACFFKFEKSELTFEEWSEVMSDICEMKDFDITEIFTRLTTCGSPGDVHVNVPQYRNFFDTYEPRSKLINIEVDST